MLPEKKQQEFLDKLEDEKIYHKFISQLNKDFALANIDVHFSNTLRSAELVKNLNLEISNLLQNNYDSYLALIYRIDISENKLKYLQTDNFEELTMEITHLIIERELLKIWLKSKFQ